MMVQPQLEEKHQKQQATAPQGSPNAIFCSYLPLPIFTPFTLPLKTENDLGSVFCKKAGNVKLWEQPGCVVHAMHVSKHALHTIILI